MALTVSLFYILVLERTNHEICNLDPKTMKLERSELLFQRIKNQN